MDDDGQLGTHGNADIEQHARKRKAADWEAGGSSFGFMLVPGQGVQCLRLICCGFTALAVGECFRDAHREENGQQQEHY
jgi:hypothetical protein